MSQATRMRAVLKGDVVEFRAVLTHEMESGQRKDESGKLIPAWFIQEVELSLNGRPILKAQWGPSVSRNPLLGLRLTGVTRSDRLALRWTDNRGTQRHDEIEIS